MNIAVFASHNGSGLQAVIDACAAGRLDAAVCAVVSNNADAPALERAARCGIPRYCINAAAVPDDEERNAAMAAMLAEHRTDIVLLMGYLKKIGPAVLRAYSDRIFNIHPALLPKYGGRGMYGMHVHRAVLEAGETVSGVTVHRVSERYDEGGIVAQAAVPVLPNDTPETLAARVTEREHTFIVEVLDNLIGNIDRESQSERTGDA